MNERPDIHLFCVKAQRSLEQGEIPSSNIFDGHRARELEQEFRAMGWTDLPSHLEPYATTRKLRSTFLQSPPSVSKDCYAAFLEGSMLGPFTEVEFGYASR